MPEASKYNLASINYGKTMEKLHRRSPFYEEAWWFQGK